jgi:hypothetical protein
MMVSWILQQTTLLVTLKYSMEEAPTIEQTIYQTLQELVMPIGIPDKKIIIK